MAKKKNPLNKRFLRQLRGDAGKYLVLFLLLTLSIGFVSGFLVAGGSMIRAYNGGFETYNIEDGHFISRDELDRKTEEAICREGVSLYPLFFVNETLDNGTRLRIYKDRPDVNKICLMKGSLPQKSGEIAIDRMYADNNHLKAGDTVTFNDQSWTVSGLVAFPDYSCLFEDNNDSMFDAVQFGTAIVGDDDFEVLGTSRLSRCYAWMYDKKPADTKEEIAVSDDLMRSVASLVTLDDFVPRYRNQAINFTGNDLGRDRASMTVLLYILIVLIAFVFAVTMANTIAKESTVIGTLLASGCTRREIVRHYMVMPAAVTVVSALIGNILGYTVLKDVCVGMYYNSYSLPTYVTVWNAEALWRTTIIPLVLVLLICWVQLRRSLTFSPLQFLRRELKHSRRQARAVKLAHGIPFLRRFRTRILLKNISSYIVMLVGIFLAYTLLIFGMFFPDALKNYQKTVPDMMFANYQYVLKIPAGMLGSDDPVQSALSGLLLRASVNTQNPDAEPFSAYSLKTTGEGGKMIESVMLYGISEGSRYLDLDFSDGKVWISSACAKKFGLKEGDSLTMKEEYEDDTYTFSVDGICDYEAAIAVFMGRETLNEYFGLGSGFFAGYLSDTPVTDIDERFIGTVIDRDALERISRQLLVSMGQLMYLVDAFALILFVIILYLITRMIIDRNSLPISMLKILGSTNREAGLLYILPSAVVTVAGLIVMIPFVSWLIRFLVVMMLRYMMPGWIPIHISPSVYVRMILYGILCYAAVTLLEVHRVKKIPMEETLKNAE